jgi:hypothetical protein
VRAESGTGPAIRPGGQVDATPPIVQHRTIPEAFRAHGAMADPDYTDFTAMACGAGDWSPGQWARALFLDAISSRTGRFILLRLLRLRRERRASPGSLARWKIAERGDRWLRLEASSWLLTDHLVVRADDEQVSVATLICSTTRWRPARGYAVDPAPEAPAGPAAQRMPGQRPTPR